MPSSSVRPVPDWATVHQELKRKGVTLQLLWTEYQVTAVEPARCYQYTQFCRLYHAWAGTLEPVLRQVHVAGERLFVDYAGPTMPIVRPRTGEITAAQIFVGALGASHLLYAEATWTQTLPDWIGAHGRILEYVGGVPALIVPDNLKSAVRSPCYYEPTLHPTYQDFATHYGTAILPARAYHPRDKAKVETAVQIVEREILAPLRHDVFHSLAELNHALAFGRERVNDRPFQKLAGSRRTVFEATERASLRPLPVERYDLAEWKTAKVNIDYHISAEGHLYSVPYRLVGPEVTIRLTTTMLEVLHQGSALCCDRPVHHGAHASAEGASAARRLDSVAPARMGRERRRGDGPRGRGDPRAADASGAGLSRLSRAPVPRASLRPAAARGRVCPRANLGRGELSRRPVDPRHGARCPATRGGPTHAASPGHARPRARPGLLPDVCRRRRRVRCPHPVRSPAC